MEAKDRYIFLEFIFTFLLLYSVTLLLGEVLAKYWLFLIFGLACGLSFSWFNRSKQSSLIRIFINIAVLWVFAWTIYSLLNSSFYYKDVVRLFIKAGIILEVIMSFYSSNAASLTYIQALSLPLFMCFPLFVKDYNGIHIIFILIYLILWAVIIKIKFYRFFKPAKQRGLKQYYPIFLSAVFFLISIFISWFIIFNFRLGRIKEGGFFPQEEKSEEIKGETLEKEYYDLQDRLQEEISKLLPDFKSTGERSEILLLLSYLIKDLPDIMEVKKAEQGLIDYLKRPGQGLEKGDIENLVILLKSYVDKKINLNIKRTKEDIMNSLKTKGFNIKSMIPILIRINKIQYTNSFQQIQKSEREIEKIIDNSLVNIKVKRDLKALIIQLKEWKLFEIYRQKINSLEIKIDSLDEQTKKEFASLPLKIYKTENLSELKEIDNKVDSLKDRMSGRLWELIREIEEILELKLEVLLSEETGDLDAWTRTKEREESKEINQIVYQKEQKNLPKETALKEKGRETAIKKDVLANIIIKVISFLLLSIIVIFFVLFLLTEREKNKLKTSCGKNPRKFILDLYENAKKILNIFGLSCNEFTPPLSYAALVEQRYSIENNLFLRFTAKFEEAKYSQHILQSRDASLVLNDYNNFLKILFSRYNKLSIFFRHLLTTLHRRPLFIS